MPSFRPLLRSLFYGAAAALVLFAGIARAEAEPDASETASLAVDRFSAAIIAAVNSNDPGVTRNRYRTLRDLVSASFNLPLMMETATGSRWRTASDDERNRATDAFLRMSIATYLSRFDDYDGEYFTVTGEQIESDGTARVSTRLIRPRRLDLPITFATQKFDGEWRIVDVLFGGTISEMAVRKSEFSAAMMRGGLPGLIDRLNEQADKILAQLRSSPIPADAAERLIAVGEQSR